MEEKQIIKSETYDMKKFAIKCFGPALCLLLIVLIYYIANIDDCRIYKSNSLFSSYEWHTSFPEFLLETLIFDTCRLFPTFCLDFGILLLIIGGFMFWAFHNTGITVTNMRVYGNAKFGKRVDLPVDSISAVGLGAFHSIAVATSSGKLVFGLIKNRDNVHKAISDLIINRQSSSAVSGSIASAPQSNADELKKHKELLDSGIITQEEFDAKKKQLLGL